MSVTDIRNGHSRTDAKITIFFKLFVNLLTAGNPEYGVSLAHSIVMSLQHAV